MDGQTDMTMDSTAGLPACLRSVRKAGGERVERNTRMNISPRKETHAAGFSSGDPVVVLYQGLHNGMPGRFVGLREDPNWADIEEQDGSIRSHPVLWLRRPEDIWSPATNEEKS
jgi:hypothetical protein